LEIEVGWSPHSPLTVPVEPKENVPRRVYIRKSVELEKYGYTVGCEGCNAARRGKTGILHKEACRKRIEERIAADGGDSSERLDKATEKVEGFLQKVTSSQTKKRGREPDDEDMQPGGVQHGGSSSSTALATGGETQPTVAVQGHADQGVKRKADEPLTDERVSDEACDIGNLEWQDSLEFADEMYEMRKTVMMIEALGGKQVDVAEVIYPLGTATGTALRPGASLTSR
jgi:hypothetical protein